jgi:hypothetical protein
MDLPLQDGRAEADAAFTRAYVARRIAQAEGNISRAAAGAAVLRPNFKRLMRKLGIASAKLEVKPS